MSRVILVSGGGTGIGRSIAEGGSVESVGRPVPRPGTPAGATSGAERHGESNTNPTEVKMSSTDGYLIEVAQATGMLSVHLAAKRPEDLPG